MYNGLHVKYLLFFSDFNETSICLTDFRKNNQISNFMKIHPVGTELFIRTSRRTERHEEVNSCFS